MSLSGDPDSGPMRVGFPIVDTYSALLAAFAMQSAYVQRERDPHKRGQFIDMSMLDASLVMMASVVNPLVISGIEPRRTGNRGFSLAPTADTFDTMDEPITIGAVQQNQYERLCTALERPDLLADPRFADSDSRMRHDRELQGELAKTFRTRPALEWEAILSNAGVPAGAVRPLTEVLKLEQLALRDLQLAVQVPNDAVGTTTILNAGFRFAHDGPGLDAPPPLCGEHTDEILAEIGMKVPQT
jgi:CoA:oxalate CoA-transferase